MYGSICGSGPSGGWGWGGKLLPTWYKYGVIILKHHCTVDAWSPKQALKSLIYKIRWGEEPVCLKWLNFEESLLPVRNAELKSWKEFGSFWWCSCSTVVQVLLIFLVLRDTHWDRRRAAALRNNLSLVFSPFLDAYACMWGVKVKESFYLLLIVLQWCSDGGQILFLNQIHNQIKTCRSLPTLLVKQ